MKWRSWEGSIIRRPFHMIFSCKRGRRKAAFRAVIIVVFSLLCILSADFVLDVFIFERHPLFSDKRYYYNVIGDEKVVAFTFDDGPDPVKTRQIMDILERHQVPATFFFLGSNVVAYPEIARMAAREHFEVGNHTFTHSHDVHSSRLRLRTELQVSNKIIKDVIGEETILYRPPFLLDAEHESETYSELDPNTPYAWANSLGYVAVGADIDSRDWEVTSPQGVIDNFFAGLEQGGHIALFHDGGLGEHTIPALEPIILELKERGYRFALASELVGINAYTDMLVTRDLEQGMTDGQAAGAVTALQTFLLKEGVSEQAPTGIFDLATRYALETWQESEGLVSELGFVGPLTRTAIAQDMRHFRHSEYLAQSLPVITPIIARTFGRTYDILGGIASLIQPLALVALGLAIIRLGGILILYISVKVSKTKRRRVGYKGGVSVLVPAYNEEENIRATILSLARSNYEPLEIIVIDDGSRDGTAREVKKLLPNYPNLSLYQIPNGGKANALNFALSKARYDVVVAIDGDTILEPQAIRKLAVHFALPDVAAVAGTVCTTTPRTLLQKLQYLEYVVAQGVEKIAFSRVNAVSIVPGPIGAWRKKDVLEAGGYSTDTLVEDQALTMALLAAGKRVLYEPSARAYTETPHTVHDFMKQRFRWIFGTLQCAWKFKSYVGDVRRPAFGFIVLPNTLVFTLLIGILYPFMDVALLIGIILGSGEQILVAYLLFTLVDLAYASLAFYKQKKEYKALLLLLPIQRLFYRVMMYYIVIRSIVKAIEGTEALWNKVEKRGDASAFYTQLLKKPLMLSARHRSS